MRKKSAIGLNRDITNLEELKKEYEEKGDSFNVRLISNMISDKYQELQSAKKESGE
jgi:hypothetical protein